MRRLAYNKLSMRSFVIYLICISTALVIITLSSTYSRITQRSDDYSAAKNAVASHLALALSGQFQLLEQTVNEIYMSSWYKKYISKAEIYQNEFHIVRQLEVSKDLLYKVSVLPLADDILILDTQNDSVICKYGWFSNVDKYTDAYCRLDLSLLPTQLKDTALFSSVKSLDERFCVISYPDPARKSTNRICVLIRLADINAYIESIHYDEFAAISLYQGGRVLMSQRIDDVQEYNIAAVEQMLDIPDLRMVFEHYDYYELHKSGIIMEYVFACLLSIVAGLLLSGLFTRFFAMPLEYLLAAIPSTQQRTHREAYHNLTTHIHSITEQNEKLKQDITLYTSDLKNDALLRLIMGGSIDSANEESLLTLLFPWLFANSAYFMLVYKAHVDVGSLALPTESQLNGQGLHMLILDIPLSYTIRIYWGEEHAALQLLLDGFVSARSAAKQNVPKHVAYSHIHCGLAQLNRCYREAIDHVADWQHMLTLAETLSLFTDIQSGKYEKAQKVLAPYQESDNPTMIRHVLSLLHRWMIENGLTQDSLGVNASRDTTWAYVDATLEALCRRNAAVEKNSNGPSIIAAVERFIYEYYALPDLSLKYLAEQFDTNISTLSRLYKQETGRNFSTALFEIRISKAKEMLVDTSNSIASISLSCGYENYLSFKRAFTRIEGISPREYRDIHRQSV